MQLLNLHSPAGTAWELFVVVVVIIAAPVMVERVRIPGLIGLLGRRLHHRPPGARHRQRHHWHPPRARRGRPAVPDVPRRPRARPRRVRPLPQPGDRLHGADVLRRRRSSARIGGLLVGYDVAGSVLLGSLFASYTLVAYPIVRNMGLAANRGGGGDRRCDGADRHPGTGHPGVHLRVDHRRRQRRGADRAGRARPAHPRRVHVRAAAADRPVVLPGHRPAAHAALRRSCSPPCSRRPWSPRSSASRASSAPSSAGWRSTGWCPTRASSWSASSSSARRC